MNYVCGCLPRFLHPASAPVSVRPFLQYTAYEHVHIRMKLLFKEYYNVSYLFLFKYQVWSAII